MKGVLVIVLLTINAVKPWNTCSDEAFCDSIRNQDAFSTFTIDSNSVSSNDYSVEARLSSDSSEGYLTLTISAIKGDIFRITIDDPTNPRQAVPEALNDDLTQVPLNVSIGDSDVQIVSGSSVASVQLSPFKISVYKDGKLILLLNEQNKMVFTAGKDDLAVAFDFTFPGATSAYGIPLHAESLELQSTGPGGLNPYRLYNVDHCCYQSFIQDSLYGAIPVLYAHSTEGTAAVFWLNAAQTFVDVNKGDGQVQSRFISESGIIDIFVLTGPTFSNAVAQYVSLTGTAPLPQMFALAYHQSRWSYATQEDAETVIQELDRGDFPFDSLWFDIDYMDGKRTFTWNYTAFPDPVGMQEYIKSTGRKVILIIETHYKVEEGYLPYDIGRANDYFVKYANGSEFVGEGFPGPSNWWDFLNPEAAERFSRFYSTADFPNTTDIVYVWNDLNEPEISNGFERTWPRHLVYHKNGLIPNTDVHNVYGLNEVRATYPGMVARYENQKRPFILTRSHFAGSQRYAAVWTGDNNSTWAHLQLSVPMCLSLSISGLSFCGADIGGFAGNLTHELYQRWYQSGAWFPFYRAHCNQYYERREPYLYPEDVQIRIRNALRQRYYHMPLWYTLFYEHEKFGEPIMRPLVYQYPSDANTHSIDNEWLVGADILVHPVAEEGVTSIQVYLPGGEDEIWYDIASETAYRGIGYVNIDVTMDTVPVYYRGGSIVSMKHTHRPSTVAMAADPYTFYVFLNSNNEASGTLYIDDNESFEYRANAYNYYKLQYEDGSLVVSKIDKDADYPSTDIIDSVIIYGGAANIREAVEMAERAGSKSSSELDYEYGPEDNGSEASTRKTKDGSLAELLKEGLADTIQALRVFEWVWLEDDARVGGEILEPFDPEDKDQNVSRWIAKIDQHGAIHGWSKYERACYMQAKLRGAARAWYNRLTDYDHSWEEWKRLLQAAFPRHHDYASQLEELVERKKREDETMSHYYHAKLALCERCDIRGERAVSCLIRGLPDELRANAYTVQSKTPEALYTGFLSGLEDYGRASSSRQTVAPGVPSRIQRAPASATTTQAAGDGRPKAERRQCYNCQEYGTHLSRDCPKPQMERCKWRRRSGHLAAACPLSRRRGKDPQVESGQKVKTYLDTGSQRNLTTVASADALRLELQPSDVILRGFGGASTVAIGETTMSVTIDGVRLRITALVMSCDLVSADLVIGQSALAQQGVTLLLWEGKTTLACGEDLSEVFRQLAVVEETERCIVALKKAVVLPAMTGMAVPVTIEGGRPGDVVDMPGRMVNDGRTTLIIIKKVLLVGGDNEVELFNPTRAAIRLKAGRVIARVRTAKAITAAESITVSTIRSSSKGLVIDEKKVGDVTPQAREAPKAVLAERAKCFSAFEGDLGLTHLGEMKVELTTNTPVYYRPYMLAYSERAIVRSNAHQLIESGVIRESNSDYASPIILVPKKNGEERLCVDYRALNRITVKDRYPLPLIDDLLDRLAGKRYYSTLDMASGYHQVPMHKESIHKTAFITRNGQYEYLRVPFGPMRNSKHSCN
ncbi:hypothetical protein Trydic_g13216 [Trypoxylus dichotomus]